jgi:SAM-dependent methyltransferase
MPDCPVCDTAGSRLFLQRPGVPVHQNLLCDDSEAARHAPRGDLEMAVCPACGFVFNRAFREDLLAYGGGYDNTQECSPRFAAHLDELARRLVEAAGIRRSVVVEVGCGKGSFLRRLVAFPGAENRGIGFDPSYQGPATDLDGRLAFRREFFGPGSTDLPVDAVVCRHVIEHVARPRELLRAVRAALAGRPRARLFLETPCVEWILGHRAVWDFFYEHCSLFSAGTLAAAVRSVGFRVDTVQYVFGGQYLWLEASVAPEEPAPGWVGGEVAGHAARYREAEAREIARWIETVRALGNGSRVAIWGAGAKGSTFANLVDPGARLIDCVVDLNPAKQGKFVLGTGHPILDYRELARRGVTRAILMNPEYRDECATLLAAAGIDAQLVELA